MDAVPQTLSNGLPQTGMCQIVVMVIHEDKTVTPIETPFSSNSMGAEWIYNFVYSQWGMPLDTDQLLALQLVDGAPLYFQRFGLAYDHEGQMQCYVIEPSGSMFSTDISQATVPSQPNPNEQSALDALDRMNFRLIDLSLDRTDGKIALRHRSQKKAVVINFAIS